MNTNVTILRLRVPVRGTRYDSAPGEQRTIMWRQSTPRVVAQARAGEPIDWGGSMVRAGDYEVVSDGSEAAASSHDCALRRGAVLCRVCDLETIEAHSKPANVL